MTTAAVLEHPAPIAVPKPARPRLHYGDPIRLIGTVAVIIGHVCDMRFWNGYGAVVKDEMSAFDFWTCCAVDVASRWAVPVFLMLSGALLLDPTTRQTPAEFFRRRFSRVGLPTLFWSPVFMLFGIYYTGWIPGWNKALTDLALGTPYAHMHFLFRIVGLYLFTPALRVFIAHVDRRMLTNTVILCFAMAGGHSVVMVLTGGQPNAFSRFVPFLGYYLCGYLLKDVRLSRGGYLLAWAGFLTTTAIVTLSMGVLIPRLGQTAPAATGAGMMLPQITAAYPVAHLGLEFLNPVRIVMGICVWLIFQNTFTRPWPDRQPWRWLSKVGAPATLGIYLVHPLFRELLHIGVAGWSFTATWHGALVGIPVTTLLILVPSTLLVAGLMAIPGVRRIVG